MRRTYYETAAKLGVQYCSGGEECTLPREWGEVWAEMHQKGLGDRNAVHWFPRQQNKRGLRNFLRCVSHHIQGEWRMTLPIWAQVYLQEQDIEGYAATLGIRFPRTYADESRARLRWLLSKVDPDDRENDTYVKALRWAARS